MRIIIAVDANIILSALLGGKPSIILFDGKYQFITTKFTIQEVKKYLHRLAKKLDIPVGKLESLFGKLPFLIYDKSFYQDQLKEAKCMMAAIDKKDVDILALALAFQTYLWSQDKDFEKCGYQKILKTYNFLS